MVQTMRRTSVWLSVLFPMTRTWRAMMPALR